MGGHGQGLLVGKEEEMGESIGWVREVSPQAKNGLALCHAGRRQPKLPSAHFNA